MTPDPWLEQHRSGCHEREIGAETAAYLIARWAIIIGGSAANLKRHVEQGNTEEVDTAVVVRAAARIESLARLGYGNSQLLGIGERSFSAKNLRSLLT